MSPPQNVSFVRTEIWETRWWDSCREAPFSCVTLTRFTHPMPRGVCLRERRRLMRVTSDSAAYGSLPSTPLISLCFSNTKSPPGPDVGLTGS